MIRSMTDEQMLVKYGYDKEPFSHYIADARRVLERLAGIA